MGLLDIVFPKNCLGCGKEGGYICSKCVEKASLSKQICPYCYKESIDGVTHTKCVKKNGLDGVVSLWRYEGVIRKALIILKYKYATEVGRELVSYIVMELQRIFIPKTDILAPVPLYWYRENFRGFNQSELLGKEVAKTLNVKFAPELLIRKKLTTPQASLKGKERRKNLRSAFSDNPDFTLSTSYSVLIFDDVFTTGSTLKECAKVLKRTGIKKVWGLTVAR